METQTMGRVTVPVRIENLGDWLECQRGAIPAERVRRIEVPDALVDTGASTLSMPKSLIERLGLVPLRARPVRTSTGPATVQVYGAVRLTVEGRDCTVDVVELPEGSPVLVGQVPLELMDFVVDPKAQRLIGNPAHGGDWVLELF